MDINSLLNTRQQVLNEALYGTGDMIMNILGHSQSLRLVISESSDTWNCIIPTLTQNTRYHSAIKGNKEEYFAQKMRHYLSELVTILLLTTGRYCWITLKVWTLSCGFWSSYPSMIYLCHIFSSWHWLIYYFPVQIAFVSGCYISIRYLEWKYF